MSLKNAKVYIIDIHTPEAYKLMGVAYLTTGMVCININHDMNTDSF